MASWCRAVFPVPNNKIIENRVPKQLYGSPRTRIQSVRANRLPRSQAAASDAPVRRQHKNLAIPGLRCDVWLVRAIARSIGGDNMHLFHAASGSAEGAP
jgi:hypothetical protein